MGRCWRSSKPSWTAWGFCSNSVITRLCPIAPRRRHPTLRFMPPTTASSFQVVVVTRVIPPQASRSTLCLGHPPLHRGSTRQRRTKMETRLLHTRWSKPCSAPGEWLLFQPCSVGVPFLQTLAPLEPSRRLPRAIDLRSTPRPRGMTTSVNRRRPDPLGLPRWSRDLQLSSLPWIAGAQQQPAFVRKTRTHRLAVGSRQRAVRFKIMMVT